MSTAIFTTKEILPVQFVMNDLRSFKDEDACNYLGTSRTSLWKQAKLMGIKKNAFGNWTIEDLDAMRQVKQAKTAKRHKRC